MTFYQSIIRNFNARHNKKSEFRHKVIKNLAFKVNDKKCICIFSHYDQHGFVDEYVIYYLRKLSVFADIVFVSTANITLNSELEKLIEVCNQVIIKENYGYDFGAWKTGMELSNVGIQNYDNLILCNDSVYGPFSDIEEIINKVMSTKDVLSITDSFEKSHHLQSYFLVYSRKAFSHQLFISFWKNLALYENKFELIRECEVKFTNVLLNSNLSVSAYCNENEFLYPKGNPSHSNWRKLLQEKNCPFIKIELLRDNPFNVSIKGWENIVSDTGYDISLIRNHLRRVKVI